MDGLDEIRAQAALPTGCPGNALGGRNDVLQHGRLLVTGQQRLSRALHAEFQRLQSCGRTLSGQSCTCGRKAFGWRCPAAQHCSCLSLMRDDPFRCPACTAEGIRALDPKQLPWWGLGCARCSPWVILWAAAVISLPSLRWQPPRRPAKGLVPRPADVLAQQKAMAPTRLPLYMLGNRHETGREAQVPSAGAWGHVLYHYKSCKGSSTTRKVQILTRQPEYEERGDPMDHLGPSDGEATRCSPH